MTDLPTKRRAEYRRWAAANKIWTSYTRQPPLGRIAIASLVGFSLFWSVSSLFRLSYTEESQSQTPPSIVTGDCSIIGNNNNNNNCKAVILGQIPRRMLPNQIVISDCCEAAKDSIDRDMALDELDDEDY